MHVLVVARSNSLVFRTVPYLNHLDLDTLDTAVNPWFIWPHWVTVCALHRFR